MTKLDRWAEIIQKLGLDVSLPINYLTATQIKVAIHEEPRLMASMDAEKAVPDVLRRNGLFLLPVSRSKYALVRGQGFHTLEDPGPPVKFPVRLPIPLTSLAYGHGESRYILHAFHSNLLTDFSGVAQLYPTVSGKMATSKFDFHVDGSPQLEANRAGMEVDFGFEGPDDLLLVEAKAVDHSTFLIRQLFYPLRTFSGVTGKRVRPIFFIADSDASEYSLWEYGWDEPDDYEQIRLRKTKRYQLVDGTPLTDRLAGVDPDPALTRVPQADDIAKVAELPFLVNAGVRSAVDWARKKGVDPRQGHYYREAAEALGLVRSVRGKFELTGEGTRYVEMAPAQRDEALALRILQNRVMNETFHLTLARGASGIDDQDIADIVRRLSPLSGMTPMRRAKTVRSYFRWLAQTTGAVIVVDRQVYSREGWDSKSRDRAFSLSAR